MPRLPLKPFWQTSDERTVRLYQGDVLDVLRRMPSGSVQCVVTSPPYWGLRDYGTAEWEGGDENCDHESQRSNQTPASGKGVNKAFRSERYQCQGRLSSMVCFKCGAKRIDEQIGSEPTPEEYIAKMVQVFRQVYKVLRDDGTLWLNMGDSYGGGKAGGGVFESGRTDGRSGDGGRERWAAGHKHKINTQTILKPGNLIGMPWRLALALQADGWILRQDIIWAKPSPMPESVRNRCTKSHEYLFLLAKGNRYYYDADAVREPHTDPSRGYGELESSNPHSGRLDDIQGQQAAFTVGTRQYNPAGRNKRSVWNISSESYAGAHFATFPQKLVEPCILAGTSAHGCCGICSAPWRRVVNRKALKRERPRDYVKRQKMLAAKIRGNVCANTVAGVAVDTLGWEPTCTCNGRFRKRKRVEYSVDDSGKEKRRLVRYQQYVPKIPLEDHPVVPCVVLDPFVGSGTTCCVALTNGRHSIGIDLSEEYLQNNAVPRIRGEILDRPALAYLVKKKSRGVTVGKAVAIYS